MEARRSPATDSNNSDEHERGERRVRKRAKSQSERRASVSSPASSSSESGLQAKTRRPTYLLQKEERDDLVEELRLLEARLELLKLKAGVSTLHDAKSVASLRAASARAEEEIHENQLRLARFHSLITRHLQSTEVFPLALYIHLPLDSNERHRILDNMKELKLRRATEVALDRLQVLDPFKPYKHEERSCTSDGLHHMNFFQVQQFRGLRDARQLYDALHYFQSNIEISVSEMIGQITVREDSEDDEPTIWNGRIVTTGEVGGVEELNTVGFGRFYENYIPHNGAQFGIATVDTVDKDDLYPYKPHERTRKDVQAVYSISEHHEPDTHELVVVLTTQVFMTQLPPAFPLDPAIFDKLVENMPRWIHVMNNFLRQATAAS